MNTLRTKREIIEALRERGIRLKKSLGQNFLIDRNLLEFIVRAAGVNESDLVLEIGAGSGLLTRLLAESAGHVVAVEIDSRLLELLKEHTAGLGNLTLLNCDVLENKSRLNHAVVEAVSRKRELPNVSSFKCVANLPYAVGTIVIPLLLESPLRPELMVFTIQKEVCDRLTAQPGGKNYGALSVIVQANAQIEMLRVLGRKVFFPEPNVDSAIVRLTPTDETRRNIVDYELFSRLAHELFGHRRKKLAGAFEFSEHFNLPREQLDSIFERASIDAELRPEKLSVEQIVRLANEFAAKVKST